MKTVLYLQPGTLVEGGYLLGHHRFPTRVQLRRLQAQFRAAAGRTGGVTQIVLEAAGTETAVTFEAAVGAGAGIAHLERVKDIALTVEAGTELRWRCKAAPDAINCFSDWALTLYYDEAGTEVRPAAVMKMVWIEEWRTGIAERFDLYRYDPVLMTFAEYVPGMAAARAVVTGGNDFAVKFSSRAANAMEATNESLRVDRQIVIGNTASREFQRLEFWIGELRVGVITSTGELRVISARQLASHVSLVTDVDRFVFNYGGSARGILGGPGVGLQSGGFVEG